MKRGIQVATSAKCLEVGGSQSPRKVLEALKTAIKVGDHVQVGGIVTLSNSKIPTLYACEVARVGVRVAPAGQRVEL